MTRIKVLLKQDGPVATYLCSRQKMYHDGESLIQIFYWQQTEQPGVPVKPPIEEKITVDNGTRLPVVDLDLNPIMHQVKRTLRNEAGFPVFWQVTNELGETYTDHAHPITEIVEEPRTIGEYSAVLWWHFDRRNPNHQPAIEEMIEEGILRRIGASSAPYHFIATPEFLAAFGDDW